MDVYGVLCRKGDSFYSTLTLDGIDRCGTHIINFPKDFNLLFYLIVVLKITTKDLWSQSIGILPNMGIVFCVIGI